MPGLERSDAGRLLDETSDLIDEGQSPRLLIYGSCVLTDPLLPTIRIVNVMKGEPPLDWAAEVNVEATKDKAEFRNYDDACERVKAFYKEQHGAFAE